MSATFSTHQFKKDRTFLNSSTSPLRIIGPLPSLSPRSKEAKDLLFPVVVFSTTLSRSLVESSGTGLMFLSQGHITLRFNRQCFEVRARPPPPPARQVELIFNPCCRQHNFRRSKSPRRSCSGKPRRYRTGRTEPCRRIFGSGFRLLVDPNVSGVARASKGFLSENGGGRRHQRPLCD